ncbi:radical SAM protein [Pelovirga terrestris]|uniref:Radical SAM protein n=1 Tax=Pelovirga terrestris TaxID=2771352 RepID=A0A8J6QYR7_9BACT|nr:radical SAM protein [Pelovirga terrestris]MBD1401478.1 radical SAM protein [Pelovirga terrestris]
MLRQVYGRRFRQEELIRKFSNRGMSSLLPYAAGIESLYNHHDDKTDVLNKAVRALAARINREIDSDLFPTTIAFADLQDQLLPTLIRSIEDEDSSALEKGARVSVRPDSDSRYVRPGSEGFITEKCNGSSRIRFYFTAGPYGTDTFTTEIADHDLQLLTVEKLIARHGDVPGVALYFYNDSFLRSMKSRLDSAVYSFSSNLAVQFLLDAGFLKVDGDELVGVPDRIFPVLAPGFDRAYQDPSLFSSPTLSCPPSERKAHVLRLELTTGCDYNRCTFCSEYTDLPAVTKSFDQFKDHVDRVADIIGSEKSRIQRLFIGSGNSLGVDTGLLVRCLGYATDVFKPEKISLYGRTTSILEKSADQLNRLKQAGLSLIYWGLESGSDEILHYIHKDCTRDDMIEASKKLAAVGIEVSAMLMPGVGGLKFSQQHIEGTQKLLHNMDIKYLTLLSINPSESSFYQRKMQSQVDNRHLTCDEVNAQIYRLLEGLKPMGVHIGMFTDEIDQASSNTMRFNCHFTEANKDILLREFWNA